MDWRIGDGLADLYRIDIGMADWSWIGIGLAEWCGIDIYFIVNDNTSATMPDYVTRNVM